MSAGGSVDIRGLAPLQKAMERLEPPELKKALQKSSTAAARTMKPYVQAETPVRTGAMKRSISAGQARKERPAAIVKFRKRVAFYRHMVMGGTKAHRIRFPDQKAKGVPVAQGNIGHPGSKPNDVMKRAWANGQSATLAAIDKTIETYLEGL